MAGCSNTAKGYWRAAAIAVLAAGGLLAAHSQGRAIEPGEDQGESAVSATPQERVDIAGSWDRAAAEALARSYLRQTKWKAAGFGPPPYTHTLVADETVTEAGRSSRVVTFATTPQNFDCHACRPYLSFFTFDERPEGWKLADAEAGVLQAGGWGGFAAQDVTVEALGNGVDGVFVDDGGTNQGVTVMNLHLFARVNGRFREVLFMEIRESVPGQGGWSSTITTVPGGTGWSDLNVVREQSDPKHILGWANGPEESRDEVANGKGDIRPHDRFTFNGSRYVRSAAAH